jgi:hypothetical protein
MADRDNAHVLQVICGELGEHCGIHFVLAECCLILAKSKAVQPYRNVHVTPPEPSWTILRFRSSVLSRRCTSRLRIGFVAQGGLGLKGATGRERGVRRTHLESGIEPSCCAVNTSVDNLTKSHSKPSFFRVLWHHRPG